MKTADIRTNHHDVSCDVCGRTLLRGERAEAFLAGGARRQVCELCTARAVLEGWIRESGAGDELVGLGGSERGRGRSLFGRLRSRREERAVQQEAEAQSALEQLTATEERARRRVRRIEPVNEEGDVVDQVAAQAPVEPPPPSREPRHVRAVPTNDEAKMQRAVDAFNASHHVRVVSGVARSLGAPMVSVRPLPERPAVVSIAVMWELSWYRFEIDLSDESGGLQKVAQGAELAELTEADRTVNAAADERGTLALTSRAAAAS